VTFSEDQIARVDARRLQRVAPGPARERAASLEKLCRSALAEPVGAPPLAELGCAARRIAVVVSDASRDEPRAEMLEAIFEHVPHERATIVVATGTHAAGADVVPPACRDLPCIVHDGAALERTADLGATREGTRVRVLRDVAEADLVVVTGRIRPHYFAGYSGGVKGVFPGCAYRDDILQNHLLKADPSARLGQVDGNRCRADMEEAALKVPGKLFLLNVLSDVDGAPVAAASGDAIAAHRTLCARAPELFEVRAPKSAVIVVADRPPVSTSLYQASKCLPPAGPLLEDGGTVILVAECDEGIEPIARVNDGIYRLGIAPGLPPRHRVLLVSSLAPDVVARSYAEFSPSLDAALDTALARPGAPQALLLWRAGECVTRVER
jgi:lactate racemase